MSKTPQRNEINVTERLRICEENINSLIGFAKRLQGGFCKWVV